MKPPKVLPPRDAKSTLSRRKHFFCNNRRHAVNVRLGGRGAAAITPKQRVLCMKCLEIAASNAGACLCICVRVLKPLCNEGRGGGMEEGREGERERGGGARARSPGSVCCAVHHCSSTAALDLCPCRGADCRSALLEREC